MLAEFHTLKQYLYSVAKIVIDILLIVMSFTLAYAKPLPFTIKILCILCLFFSTYKLSYYVIKLAKTINILDSTARFLTSELQIILLTLLTFVMKPYNFITGVISLSFICLFIVKTLLFKKKYSKQRSLKCSQNLIVKLS